MLAKVVQANRWDWDAHLPKILFAYRTAVHESTHFSLYHLTFGCSPMLPVATSISTSKVVKLSQFVDQTHQQAVDKKEYGETFSLGIMCGCTPRQLKKVAVQNWLPVAWSLLLWTRQAPSITISSLLKLELDTKLWCIAIIWNQHLEFLIRLLVVLNPSITCCTSIISSNLWPSHLCQYC